MGAGGVKHGRGYSPINWAKNGFWSGGTGAGGGDGSAGTGGDASFGATRVGCLHTLPSCVVLVLIGQPTFCSCYLVACSMVVSFFLCNHGSQNPTNNVYAGDL